MERIVEDVEIQYLTAVDDYDQPLHRHGASRVSGESTNICGI